MALSKDGLNKISNLIKAGNESLDVKWGKRFDGLEIKVDTGFNKVDKRLMVVEKKIDQLIKTENEDILAVFNDLQGVKTRLKKAGI